ncbi:MAG: hypothetical protein HGGPFJEG_00684 [Ignavibacteria bacterium]|nr:hypothetical protein [Ignavibacteria bacterium]
MDPLDRISEILFGLIMVLTFTCTISITSDFENEVRNMLWAALGCNFAWGIVDAVMFLMNIVLERGHNFRQINRISHAENIEDSRKIARDSISPHMSELNSDKSMDEIVQNLKKLPEPEHSKVLTLRDFIYAFEVFLLVFISTFPVVVSFIFLYNIYAAMRVSNAVALVMLFVMGYLIVRHTGFKPITTSLVFILLGIILVARTIALGG